MSLFIYFSHACPVKIWGRTSQERIELVLKTLAVPCDVQTLSTLQQSDSVLILRGDYLFDDRLVKSLVSTPDVILTRDGESPDIVVAAHVPGHLALQALSVIEGNAGTDALPGMQLKTPATISVSYEETLRKFESPFLLPITAQNKQKLERRLFDWSYKGITDLVTKWAWPYPARWVVGFCVRLNIRPNHVTLCGLFLVILAGILFTYGYYGWGLLAGWVMTFLDTVDGKLARVTITSSRFGYYFDHIIDLVHPPIWYIVWGLGLTATQLTSLGFSLNTLAYVILVAYIAGRFVEGSFKVLLGNSFHIYCWQPIDSYFRLITARRNPNMILLTLSVLLGRPELGLLAVTFWTVATSVVLLGRLVYAGYIRFSQGSLRSWLADADTPKYNTSLAARIFTKQSSK